MGAQPILRSKRDDIRLQLREVYWVIAIIPIVLAARYLPALAILGLAPGISIGSLEHRIQLAAMYVAWGATGVAGIGLSRVALLGAFQPKIIQLAAPLLIIALSAFTEFALMAWAYGTYGKFERDTYGPVTIVPDLGVLTACLVFAVLIARPTTRFVVGLAGLAGSMLALWTSTAALSSIGDGLTRALAGLLAVVLVPTVLGLGVLVVRGWAPPRLSGRPKNLPGA
jgi:hypothetical protein